MLLSTSNSAFSLTNDAGNKNYLFIDNFTAKHFVYEGDSHYYYDEIYYHRVDENDSTSEIDWAIVYALLYAGNASSVKGIIADRVVVSDSMNVFYEFGWALYDVESNEFIAIEDVNTTKYDGFEKGLEEAKVGNPLGDANLDGTLNILDATYIQMVMAKLCEFNEMDDLSYAGTWGVQYNHPLKYISDINGDGERNILDATAIQLKLAGIE